MIAVSRLQRLLELHKSSESRGDNISQIVNLLRNHVVTVGNENENPTSVDSRATPERSSGPNVTKPGSTFIYRDVGVPGRGLEVVNLKDDNHDPTSIGGQSHRSAHWRHQQTQTD